MSKLYKAFRRNKPLSAFLAVLLSVAMVTSTVPTAAWAEMVDEVAVAAESAPEPEEEVTAEPQVEPEVEPAPEPEPEPEEEVAPSAEEPVEEVAPSQDDESTDSTVAEESELAPEEEAAELEDDEEAEEEEKPATKTVYEYKDSAVKVTATLDDPEDVPDEAELKVTEVIPQTSDFDAYLGALNESAYDETYTQDNTLLYDVTFEMVDEDGNLVEVEPKAGETVRVKFQFLRGQLVDDLEAERAADVEVNHLPETSAGVAVEPMGTKASGEGTISVSTDSFSVFSFSYTVDFTYDGYTYSFPGQGSYALADVLAALGINDSIDSAELKLVEGMAIEGDLYLTKPDGVWHINSDVPFTSTYELSVKSGNATYVITVTDVAESSDLSNFLTNAVISGATQNAEGKYEVEQGKDYSIILTFAEGSNYQFDNDAELTYQMPAGIAILSEQAGPTTINIVYKGRTYQVDATYSLGTDGNLKIKFDENDPDYPRLEESTNVSFRFTYRAQFDGSETHIRFNDGIERDIVFDEPEPGQAYANKTATYDETTGKFTYTIKVTASGDVTNVNVKDVISGDAIIFNNDVQVSGNSSDYTDNHASNGFDYTFASMREGEEITITYTGTVDFNKDTDGDGKITADQTKNTVTVEPEDGPPHNSEYSREISFKGTVKSDGTEVGTTETGDKIIEWTIDYNQLALAKAGGDTIKDTIAASSAEYMKYYGDGIKVEVRNHAGTLVRTDNISYSDLTAHSDSSWTYTIPDTDTTPYSYHIIYQTVVDMDKVNGGGVAVSLNNNANGDGGGTNVGPTESIGITKAVESYTTEEVRWVSTLNIPAGGLTQAVVTDTLPVAWFSSANHFDLYKDGTLDITGLLPGESYDVSLAEDKVVITFYKDSGKTQTGLQEHTGGHTVTVKLTTKVNQEWLEYGYDPTNPAWLKTHENKIDLNGKEARASVVFDKPGIKKTGAHQGGRSFKYTVVLTGVSDTPVSVLDTFDTSLLEIDPAKTGAWDHMKIWGGNQYSQDDGGLPVSYSETSDGIILAANTLPMDNGNYYSHYKIIYYLRLKEGVDLEQLAIANGGEHHLINTAKWGDHESEFDYKTEYDYLDKELLNAGELGGTDRTAQYRITFNSAKATLNGGEPMTMTDTLSSNLSVDYSSIQITTDPAGASVPYSLSGGDDGTTVATYTVPDSTKVVITYSAQVRGNGSQKINNKVEVNGKEDTVENTKDYGSASEGEGAVASFKIVKVDGYDANKKLEGVQFKIFCENNTLDFGEKVHHAKEIFLTTDSNGEIELDGDKYDFYFDEIYHIQEVAPLDDYGKISFDYLVTLTNDMSKVDYGHYIYYYDDAMQIKNWPLEGLVVEKQVESEEAEDLDRYYNFKVSILDDNGEVDTSYNEKNGDDQFVNGVAEFQLKDGEQKMFWGFAKYTKYKVEEVFTGDDGAEFTTEIGYDTFDEEGNVTEHKTKNGTSHTGTLTQSDETIVFTNKKEGSGSLKLTKLVKVKGADVTDDNKALTNGTYTFTIASAEEGSGFEPVTVTITYEGGEITGAEGGTLGDDGYVTVTGLTPGDYTITETAPTNGTTLSSAAGGKSVSDAKVVTVTVAAGETIAATAKAEFTNNIDTEDVEGEKVWYESDGETEKTEWPSDVTSVSVKLQKSTDDGETWEDVSGKTATLTSSNSSYSFKDLPKTEYVDGELKNVTYKVVETETNPENIPFTVVEGSGVKDDEGKYNISNQEQTGGLKLKKDVTVNSEATTGKLADGTYTFTIASAAQGSAFTPKTVTILIEDGRTKSATGGTLGDDGYVTVTGLTPGDYTITETAPTNGTTLTSATGGKSVSDAKVVTVTVAAGETIDTTATASFTNNVDTGSLTIKKNVTVNGDPTTGKLADGTYSFTVTGPNNYEETVSITISDGQSNTATLSDLVPGEYTVTEDVSSNPKGMALVGENGKMVNVEGGKTAEVKTAEFTNDRTEVGKLKIKKNVTVNGATTTGKLADGDYTFEVKDAAGTVKATETITITDGVSNEVTVENLVPGTYTVTETETANGTSLVGNNDIQITIEEGKTSEVKTAEFTNNIDLGNIKVTKTVSGASANDKEFTVTITNADGKYLTANGTLSNDEQKLTVSNASPIEISNIPLGNYTVAELDENREITNYTFVSVTGEDTKAVTKAATTQFDLTNTYERKKGSLKLQKLVEGTTEKTKSFTFTITFTAPTGVVLANSYSAVKTSPLTGETSETAMLSQGTTTVQLKADETYQINGLPVGTTWVVAESSVPDGYTLESITPDPATGTISTDVASSTVVATNKYTAEGKAHLEAIKAIEGADWPRGGEITFTVTSTNTTKLPAKPTVKLTAAGTADFGDIAFDRSDAGKTYTYTITETANDSFGTGWSANPKTITATVKVGDDLGNGKLDDATVTYDPEDAIVTNTYTASGTATIEATKKIVGTQWPKDGKVIFNLAAKDGAPMPTDDSGAEVSSLELTSAGTVTFETIHFTLADHLKDVDPDDEGKRTKEFVYEITETATGFDTWTGSPDKITATVTVTDNGTGKLETSVAYNPTDKTITNTQKKGNFQLTKKVLNSEKPNESFTFSVGFASKNESGGAYPAVITAANGSEVLSTTVGIGSAFTIELKAGETLTVTGLPVGVNWTVDENVPEGYTASYSPSNEGTIEENDNDNTTLVTVTNTYTPEKPTFEKKIKDTNDTTGETSDWQDSADYDIGDKVPYRLTATLPTDVTSYKRYHITFTDQMEESLTFDGITSVTVNGNAADYTLDESSDHSFKLSLAWGEGEDVAITDALNGAEVCVYFDATLNSAAVLGSQGNVNGAKLTYSNKPGTSETGDTDWDYVIAFTYKVDVNKVDPDEKPLEGAEFKLEKKLADGTLKLVELDADASSAITFSFKGLDDGDYVLTETKAPKHYKPIDPIEFTVTAEHNATWDANNTGANAVFTFGDRTSVLSGLSGEATTGELELKPDLAAGSLAGDVMNTELGKLKIKKNVTVNGAETTGTEADGTYTFQVTGPDDYSEEFEVTIKNGESNTVTVEDLYAGTYIVTELTEKNPTGIYLLSDEEVEVEVEEGKNAEVNTAEFDNTKPGTPDFEKKIKDTNDTTGETSGWQDSADYDIGDAVPYRLTATLPNDVTSYKAYHITFTDQMEESLDYNKDAKVFVNGTEFAGTLDKTEGDHGFELTLRWAGEGDGRITDEALNGAVVEVYFTATLNGKAKLGAEGNVNAAKLTYSNMPGTTKTGDTPWDYVIAFTYKLDVNKVDQDGEALEGAEFKLEKKMVDGSLKAVDLAVKGNVFSAKGLDDGDYVLTETKAPKGYKAIDPITFTVAAEHKVEWDYTSGDFAPYPKSRTTILESLTGDEKTGKLKLEADETLEGLTGNVENEKHDKPDFEKKIKDTNDTTGETSGWQDSADYDIGDAVPYRLTATLPNDVTSYKHYHITFTDQMERSLTFDEGSVQVFLNGTKLSSDDYKLTKIDDQNFTVRLDWDGGKDDEGNAKFIADESLNKAVVEVEFTATLNGNAKLGAEGNVNGAKLAYSNNSLSDEDEKDTEDTPWDYVIAFTYKLDVNKVDQDGEALEGAEFKLEKKMADGTKKAVDLAVKGNVFSAKGLDDGDYVLTETKAPKGYETVAPIEFTVTAEHKVVWNASSPAADEATFDLDGRNSILESLTGSATTGELTLTPTENLEGLTGDITNTRIEEKTSISIKKLWVKNGKAIAWPTGAKVTVALTADGKKVDECTLTAKKSSYTFKDLPKTNKDGSAIVYKVTEVSVSGVSDKYNTTVSGNAAKGFTIKNSISDTPKKTPKKTPKSLPKTNDPFGQTALYLAGAGALLAVGGVLYKRRNRKEEDEA